MRGTSWLVVVLVVAALVGWWALPKESAVLPPMPAAAEAELPASTESTAAPDSAAVQQVGEADPKEAERQAAPAPDADAAASATGPSFEVLVVDGASSAPLPGADAYFLPWTVLSQAWQWPQGERDYALYYDQADVARRLGRHARTDAEGRVRFAAEATGGAVFAMAGGKSADGNFGNVSIAYAQAPPEGHWTVRMEPDRTLHVRTVDARGSGRAGVFVEVQALDRDGKRASPVYLPPIPSGPDGALRLPHCQTWLRPNGGEPVVTIARWRVGLLVPGVEDPGVEFDPSAPPAEPIELRLPGTGAVVVGVVHAGERLRRGFDVQVWRGSEQDAGNAVPRVAPAADGLVRYEPVALGGELVVRANVGVTGLTQTVAGPRGDGETVRVEFTTERLYALAGTLVGPDGELLRNRTAQTDFDLEVTMGGGSVTTDERGRFLWFLTEGHRDQAQLKKLVFSIVPVDDSPLRASIAPRPLQRGVVDLGVVRLDRGPLVVQGRIVADGKPPRGQWWLLVERVSERRNRDGSERWEEVEGLTRGYFEDGRFEFRGETTAARHRLRLPGNDHLPVAPLEFVPGATDVAVDVRVGHELAAKVRLPDAVAAQNLLGVLRPKFAPPPESADPDDRYDRDRYSARGWGPQAGTGQLAWSGLPAGTYELEIRVEGAAQPVLVLADVVLPPPAGGDPRLQHLDLRELVRSVRLDVTFVGPATGRQLPGYVLVFGQPQSDPRSWQGTTVAVGGNLLLPIAGGELLVCSDGFAPARVLVGKASASGADRVAVELGPWPTTEVFVAGLPELPGGVEFLLQVRGSGSGVPPNARYRTSGQSGPLESLLAPYRRGEKASGGKVRVTLGEGDNRLDAYLVGAAVAPSGPVQLGSGSAALPVSAPRPVRLMTLAPQQLVGSAVGPITVQVDPAEVAAAIQTLQAAK